MFDKKFEEKDVLVHYFDEDGNLLHVWETDGVKANNMENIKEAVCSTGLVANGQRVGVEISLDEINMLATEPFYNEYITI